MISGEIFLLVKEKFIYAAIIAVLPLGLMAGLYLIKNLEYTLLAVLFTAAFIPFSIPTGRGSPLVASLILSMGLAGIWFLKMVIVEKRFSLIQSPVNTPAIGFMIVTLISVLWSTLLRDPFIYVSSSFLFVQIGAACVMVISPAIMLMTANFTNHLRLLQIMFSIMLLIGFLGLVENFAGINLFVNIGGITAMWVIALCTGVALFQKNLNKKYQSGLLLITGLWVFWSFFLHRSWLAGWLPGLVALAVIFFFYSKRLLLIGIIFLVGYFLINTALFSQDISKETAESGFTRLAAWQANWSVTKDHLLFGTGPAGYAAYYMTLFPTNAMATHSNYVDIIAETGVVGTFFYLWMFGAMALQGYRLIQRLRGQGDFQEALAVALFGGLIGCIIIMGFGDWLLPFAYTQTIAGYSYTVYSWLFLGALLALDHLTRDQKSTMQQPLQHS